MRDKDRLKAHERRKAIIAEVVEGMNLAQMCASNAMMLGAAMLHKPEYTRYAEIERRADQVDRDWFGQHGLSVFDETWDNRRPLKS